MTSHKAVGKTEENALNVNKAEGNSITLIGTWQTACVRPPELQIVRRRMTFSSPLSGFLSLKNSQLEHRAHTQRERQMQ